MWTHFQIADDEYFSRVLSSDALPPISVLVPAYNEEVTIASSVLSFLTLKYPRHEVVLVNDGSKDRTMDELIRAYDLYEIPVVIPRTIPTAAIRAVYRSRTQSRLLVIDKENGGKADSLNAAINAARFPYVIACDADTLIEPDALLRLARPFLLGREIAAIGGTIRVVNACKVELGRVVEARVDTRWLPGCQTVEYLRAFLFGRLGWNRIGGNLIISGAFGLFARKYLLAVGGYQVGNVTEDMDLAVRLHLHLRQQGIKASMPFIPDPVAWTEVPSSRKILHRQRERWHRGLIGTVWERRRMIFNPRYGAVGMVALPFFAFGEMIAPVVELLGYLGLVLGLALGAVNMPFAAAFLAVAVGYGILLSMWAIVLEEVTFRRYNARRDLWRLFFFAIVEGIGYRQLTVIYRLHAFWKVMRGEKGWGVMQREGFAKPVA
ncbi:MAG: glycosyltransferase family 2 protein [Gemmatimonadaceae bacterium]|nr:glycosyltransferase family 2 protein [Gemmatimonadaceae bacterium]